MLIDSNKYIEEQDLEKEIICRFFLDDNNTEQSRPITTPGTQK